MHEGYWVKGRVAGPFPTVIIGIAQVFSSSPP